MKEQNEPTPATLSSVKKYSVCSDERPENSPGGISVNLFPESVLEKVSKIDS